ncbi:MAG: CopD family protein [Thermoproteota archaeon]|nr:CopD family protein [Thermoproteota archaeon]
MTFDSFVFWIHLVFSSIWVGGSIFLGIVLAPFLKKTIPDVNKRILFMVTLGRRFNVVAGPSLLILVGTGIYNARSFLDNPSSIFGSEYGYILLIKIILVCITILIYVIHILILNKNVEDNIIKNQVPDSYFKDLRNKIILLGRITVVLSIGILFLAAVLNNGGI